MNKRYALLIVFIGLIVFFSSGRKNTPEIREVSSGVKEASVQEAEEERPGSAPVRKIRLISDTEVRKLRNTFPDTVDVRKEVEENPHETPDSLIKFASTLGPLVEKAMKNPEDAHLLVKVLGDCVSQDSLIVSARTVCLSKAEQIAKAWPEQRFEVAKIRENANEDVTNLSGKMNSYMKKQ